MFAIHDRIMFTVLQPRYAVTQRREVQKQAVIVSFEVSLLRSFYYNQAQ